MSPVFKKRFITPIKWNDLFQPQENFGQVRYILILSPIISKNAIISRLVAQSPFYFILIIWVSKSPSHRFSYKFIFFYQKSTDFISYLFCWILSIKYWIVQRMENQFLSIWLGIIWNISVSEVKFLILSSGSLDSSDDSSDNS